MTVKILTEGIVKKIREHITTNINLSSVQSQWDTVVNLIPIKKIYLAPEITPVQTPALIVECLSMNRNYKGDNYLHSDYDIGIIGIVDNTDAERLTLSCYRYASAIVELFFNTNFDITVPVGYPVKFNAQVESVDYDDTYFDDKTTQKVFRKKFLIKIKASGFENI